MLQKAGLRKAFRELRIGLGAEARADASRQIGERISTLEAYRDAQGVAVYWPLETEVDLRPFIALALESGRKVFLPRVNDAEKRLEFASFDGKAESLVNGPFGLLEPQSHEVPISDINLIIVPGLAFDMHGHRLGYGAGYYDRSLKSSGAATAGVAFDIQTIDILPIAEHDVAVDIVVTESRVF